MQDSGIQPRKSRRDTLENRVELWPFFGKSDANTKATYIKKVCFFELKSDILRVWGTLGTRSGNREAKRSVCPRKPSPFWRSFWHLFGIFAGTFLSVFSCALIFCTLGDFGAQRCRKGRFWEPLLMPFWGQGQKVKIDVLCRRQLVLEGSGGSENR